MMQMLQYIGQHDQTRDCISMLLLADYNGTLMYRAGCTSLGRRQSVGEHWLATGRLQSGGLYHYGRRSMYGVCQYLFGYAVPPEDQRARRVPQVRFESRLYKDIYQNN